MLKELIIQNISIEGDLSKTVFIRGSGKIINVFVEFNKETSSTIKLKIRTRIGETVLNVNNINKEESEVFYPRLNSTAGREHEAVMPEELEASSEYYYFKDTLFFHIEKDNIDDKGILIKKVIVLYEE